MLVSLESRTKVRERERERQQEDCHGQRYKALFLWLYFIQLPFCRDCQTSVFTRQTEEATVRSDWCSKVECTLYSALPCTNVVFLPQTLSSAQANSEVYSIE